MTRMKSETIPYNIKQCPEPLVCLAVFACVERSHEKRREVECQRIQKTKWKVMMLSGFYKKTPTTQRAEGES